MTSVMIAACIISCSRSDGIIVVIIILVQRVPLIRMLAQWQQQHQQRIIMMSIMIVRGIMMKSRRLAHTFSQRELRSE